MDENGRFDVFRVATVVGHCLLVKQDVYWERYMKSATAHGLNSVFCPDTSHGIN